MAGLCDHPAADRHDEPAFLGNGDEFCRRHQPEFGMKPPEERLDADDIATLQVYLGLVMQQQFVPLQSVAQHVL